MAIYIHAHVRAVPGHMPELLDLLRNELFPIMEAGGWRLVCCLRGVTGSSNTLFDTWELDDMEHFRRAYDQFRAHPNFKSIRERLDKFVREESVALCERVT